MTKSQLVPTPIVNKNGVATTVHKRADATGDSLTLLPAPVIAANSEEESLARVQARVAAAIISVQDKEDLNHGIHDFDVLERRLYQWEPAVTRAYDKVLSEHVNVGYEELLVSSLNNDNDSKTAEYILLLAQQDEMQDSNWSRLDGGTYLYGHAKEIYNGLRTLDGKYNFDIPESPYETNDQHSIDIIKALTIVTNEEYYSGTQKGLLDVTTPNGEGLIMLYSDDLIKLIARRPEDARRIAEIFASRSSPDVELLERILDTESTALSDGII